MFYARAPTQEPRCRNKFQKLCSCLRVLLLPPGFCRCLVSCLFAWSRFLLCRCCALFFWLPSVGADPKQPSTLEGNTQVRIRCRSTWLLTFVETLGCLLYFAQYNSSAFSLSSIIAFAYLAFHRFSRERKRYCSLWSSVFPVPSARRGLTSCYRLSPNARRHNSSRQPRRTVFLARAVAAAVRDRRCGVFRHADSLELSSSSRLRTLYEFAGRCS